MDLASNYQFADYIAGVFGADIYLGTNGKIYVRYRNNLFNSTGYLGLFSNYEPQLIKLSDEQAEKLLGPYQTSDSNVSKNAMAIIDGFEQMLKPVYDEIFRLTQSRLVKQLSGNKINLVLHDGQYKILLIVDEFLVNAPLNVVENFYLTLSKLGLTPKVHQHGQLEAYDIKFLYLLTDYISSSEGAPLTLRQIQAGPLKNELLKRALVIIYAIHGMGYCNQDIHDDNFLYDQRNDKVYGIDFTDIMLCTSQDKLNDTFYLKDLDRRVSFEEIINGVY